MSKQYASRKGVWGWMFFDWASQPFNTLIVTFIFAPYFAGTVVSDAVQGQEMWAGAVTIASLAIAFSAPLLGALADQIGPRKPFIFAFLVIFFVGCFGLWWSMPGAADPTFTLIMFGIAFVGAEYMLIFTNAMLPDLVPREDVGKVSGAGWGFGYLGGIVPLFVVILLMSPMPGKDTTLIGLTPLFGLDAELGEPARATGPLSAVWMLVFIIPLFLWTPDVARRKVKSDVLRASFASLLKTLKEIKRFPSLLAYLAGSMVYRDAMVALFAFGGIYAGGVLGWGPTNLGIFGILAAFTGAVGAWYGGLMDKKFGPKPVIVVSILALTLVGIVTISTSRDAVFFVPVDPESSTADIIFYICGGILGAASGALQAASRTLLIHQAEGRISMTEAFGLYALSGKATAFIGPFLIFVATKAFNDQQLGVTPVIGLFIIGLIILRWVKTEPVK